MPALNRMAYGDGRFATTSNAEFLTKYFGAHTLSGGPLQSDIAKFIVLNADRNRPLSQKKSEGDGNEPSIMGRIFDILSRPNYAVAEGVRTMSFEGVWKGLTGEKKTTFADVLEERGVENDALQGALGLGLDIVLDPLTWIPGGALVRGAKSVGRAARGTSVASQIPQGAVDRTLAQRMLSGDKEPINPELYGLPAVDRPSIPAALRRPSDEARVDLPFKPAELPIVPRATDTITGQLELPFELGDVPRGLPRTLPPPEQSIEEIVNKAVKGQYRLPIRKDRTLPNTKENLPRPLTKEEKAIVAAIKSVASPENWRGLNRGQKSALRKEINKGLDPDQRKLVDDIIAGRTPVMRHPNRPDLYRPDLTAASQIPVKKADELIDEGTVPPAPVKAVSKPDKRDVADAARIVNQFDPSKATADINKKFPESLNAKQQVRLYYSAREAARKRFKNPNSPANAGRVDNIALKIYQAIEQSLESGGLVPRIGTGDNVKLSDVIGELGARRGQEVANEFSNDFASRGDVYAVVEAIRARGAMADSGAAKTIADAVQATKTQTESSKLLSDGQLSQIDRVLKGIGTSTARAEALSPAAVNATTRLVGAALTAGKSPALLAVEGKAKVLDDIVANGAKKRAEVNGSLTRALEKDLGKCPKWAQSDNKAVEFMMGRVATWWGQKDLRPLSLNAIGSASATAQARGKALDRLFAPFNPMQRQEAFRLAQGIGAPTSEATYQLATQIRRMMDNLVGQVSGQSVLLRSAVDMDMLNKWMDRYRVGFRFTNKMVKTGLGETVDLSKGTDWLNTWKTFTPNEDPKVFLFKMNQALEQATREKALFDEIGERFGQKAPGGPWRARIDHPYISEYYFTDDICRQLPRLVKDWSVGDWNSQSNSKLVRLYDRVLSMWKAGVTIYRPGHHIRNMIGDVYLGWMDGVNSVRPYVLAARVQRTLKDSYSDLQDVDRLVQLGVMGKQYGTPMPGEVLFRNKSGVEFTADQIAAVAHQKGLLEHARTLEDIIDLGEGSKFKPFGGRVQAVARGASELQAHNARLAHFIDKVIKSRGANLEKIFEDASRRARKWHPTGLDLTDFERRVMRRIIPFYSWIRKSTPLLIEGLAMNPGKAVIPAKLWDAIQETQGIETPGRHDPFPTDQMFPEWLRAQGTGPISTGTGFLGRFSDQNPAGYVMGGMGINPLADLMAQSETPGKTILSSLTPAVGIPLELMQGRKTFTGEPITGPEARPGAFSQYVGEQIPYWSPIQSLTGITPFGDETKAFQRSDTAGRQALVNWLTGLGIRGTGPYVRQARFEERAPVLAERRAGKDAFMEELRRRVAEYAGS
jgi:hypothetical protein